MPFSPTRPGRVLVPSQRLIPFHHLPETPFSSNHNPPVTPINNTSAMSFRTAARFTARLSVPRTLTRHVARRAASSSAGPKIGSDTPWIIGSAVGFGTLVREFLKFPDIANMIMGNRVLSFFSHLEETRRSTLSLILRRRMRSTNTHLRLPSVKKTFSPATPLRVQ